MDLRKGLAILGAVILVLAVWWLALPEQDEQAQPDPSQEASSAAVADGENPAEAAALAYFRFADEATRNPDEGWDDGGTLAGVSNVAAEEEAWLLEGYVDAYRDRNTRLGGEWQTTILSSRAAPKEQGFIVDVCRDPSEAWNFDEDAQKRVPPGDERRKIRLVVKDLGDGWRVTQFKELTDQSC